MIWFIQKSILTAMEKGSSSVTSEQIAAFNRDSEPSASDTPSIYSTAGDRATIKVDGVLTQKPNIFAMLFGGGNTTYANIVASIDAAERDPNIKEIYLEIDSPGGTVAGMYDAMDAIQNATKPTTAVGRNNVASAAYGLASQADKLLSSNRSTRFGSVGVATEMYVSENYVTIANKDAPRKRPDVSTEEGKLMVQEELDEMAEMFMAQIATGRGVTLERVKEDFGQGGMFLADKAQQRGMIDGVSPSSFAKPTTATSGGNQPEAIKMDPATLQAQHPDVYAAVMKLGEDKEHKRACDHIKLGAASGDEQLALNAIKDRKDLAECQADYMAASLNRRDSDDAAKDDDDIKAAAGNLPKTEPKAGEDKAGEEVAKLVEQLTGTSAEA